MPKRKQRLKEFMPKRKHTRTHHQTWKDLSINENFQDFFKGYLALLQKTLQKREVIGQNYSYSYYTCGQSHDPKNQDWKPFQNLQWHCQKNRYDFYAVKDIIEERIGRKLLCECQIFNNEKEMRRKELERVFGVDFQGCDLVD